MCLFLFWQNFYCIKWDIFGVSGQCQIWYDDVFWPPAEMIKLLLCSIDFHNLEWVGVAVDDACHSRYVCFFLYHICLITSDIFLNLGAGPSDGTFGTIISGIWIKIRTLSFHIMNFKCHLLLGSLFKMAYSLYLPPNETALSCLWTIYDGGGNLMTMVISDQ